MAAIAPSRCGANKCLLRAREMSTRTCREPVRVRASGSEMSAPAKDQSVDDVEVMTPEKAEKAMELGLGSALQLTVSLTAAQV